MSQFDRTKWDAKYADATNAPRNPSHGLLALSANLPKQGRALEIAAGGGRHAIWLAQRGLDVTAADISQVGLEIAAERARQAKVSLRTLQIDLEQEAFPAGPWDLILSVCYLQRSLFAIYPQVLAPGGRLIVIQPTAKNLERHEKPPRDFLLDDGELPRLVAPLKILYHQEGWSADDRHDAVILAERPKDYVSIPSDEDFARAHHEMRELDRGLAEVAAAVMRRMQELAPLKKIIVFCGSSRTHLSVYVFYESTKDIDACDRSGVSLKLEVCIYEELERVGRGSKNEIAVTFEYDSHERVNGNYWQRLR